MDPAPDPLFDVTGLRVAVTGAAGDIGRPVVAGLAARGCRVAAVDRDPDALSAAARGWPEDVETLAADVTDEARVESMFGSEIPDRIGGLDALFNNAGIMLRSPPEETSLDDWHALMRVNLDGTFLCARAAGGRMLEQGRGAIVNTSSIASLKALEGRVAYCTSKGAISHMTRVMALEWGARGVRVNALAPGFIASRMNADLRAIPEKRRRMIEQVPMARFGEPDELIGALVFLISPASSYVNGQVLFVDGGLQVT
jgi:NAD(P)-dependent dehydrogenase (short-subunit alcohol dehydrogenase family)